MCRILRWRQRKTRVRGDNAPSSQLAGTRPEIWLRQRQILALSHFAWNGLSAENGRNNDAGGANTAPPASCPMKTRLGYFLPPRTSFIA